MNGDVGVQELDLSALDDATLLQMIMGAFMVLAERKGCDVIDVVSECYAGALAIFHPDPPADPIDAHPQGG